MADLPPSQEQRLRSLKERADALEKGAKRPEGIGAGEGQAANQAYKLIAELLGGVIVGVVLGFGVDRLTGHPPIGLIGGVLLGFAVSLWMAKRTADRLMAQAQAEAAQRGNAGAEPPSVPFDED